MATIPGAGVPVSSTPITSRRDQVNRLAQHGGFGFDASDAPAEDAYPVDHGCMAVGTTRNRSTSGRFS